MNDRRGGHRQPMKEPVTFHLGGISSDAELLNISGTGALFRFSRHLPIGPESVGGVVKFSNWGDVGALIRPQGTVVRFFEDEVGKNLAVKFKEMEKDL